MNRDSSLRTHSNAYIIKFMFKPALYSIALVIKLLEVAES